MWRLSLAASAASAPSTAASCRSSSATVAGWLRSAVERTRAGAYLLARFDSFKRRQRDDGRRRVTNAQLRRLNRKIDKLLSRLDDVDHIKTNGTNNDENECVVCLSATATMQTFPCAHRVTCRRCFVRTIQTAISDRNLPLRCVVCRARILTLNEPPAVDDHVATVQTPSFAAGAWIIPAGEDRYASSRPTHSTSTKNADGEQRLTVRKKHAPHRRQKQSNDDQGRFVGKNV